MIFIIVAYVGIGFGASIIVGPQMNNQEILTKAIQKAIDNGWNHATSKEIAKLNLEKYQYEEDGHNFVWLLVLSYTDGAGSLERLPLHFYYDHDFAKALWGNKEYSLTVHDVNTPSEYANSIMVQQPMWSYHLQQMVIADNPIRYIGDNIPA